MQSSTRAAAASRPASTSSPRRPRACSQRNPPPLRGGGSHPEMPLEQLRAGGKLRRRALEDDLALGHDEGAVGEAGEGAEVLVDDDGRNALGADARERAPDLLGD